MFYWKVVLGVLLAALLALTSSPATPKYFSTRPSTLTTPFQNAQYIPHLQNPPWIISTRPWETERSNSRCRSHTSVSVNAFLGYEHGHDAAKKLLKLAKELRKLVRSKRLEDIRRVPDVVTGMRVQFHDLEQTRRVIRTQFHKDSNQKVEGLENPLATGLISESLAKLEMYSANTISNRHLLEQEAKQFQTLIKDWQKSAEEAGKVLCLQ